MAGPKSIACHTYSKYIISFGGHGMGWSEAVCAAKCDNDPACVEVHKYT